jgi:hypothetical protein
MGRRISNSRSRLADLQSGGLLGQADAAPSHATMKRLLTELGMDVAFTTSADFTTPSRLAGPVWSRWCDHRLIRRHHDLGRGRTTAFGGTELLAGAVPPCPGHRTRLRSRVVTGRPRRPAPKPAHPGCRTRPRGGPDLHLAQRSTGCPCGPSPPGSTPTQPPTHRPTVGPTGPSGPSPSFRPIPITPATPIERAGCRNHTMPPRKPHPEVPRIRIGCGTLHRRAGRVPHPCVWVRTRRAAQVAGEGSVKPVQPTGPAAAPVPCPRRVRPACPVPPPPRARRVPPAHAPRPPYPPRYWACPPLAAVPAHRDFRVSVGCGSCLP